MPLLKKWNPPFFGKQTFFFHIPPIFLVQSISLFFVSQFYAQKARRWQWYSKISFFRMPRGGRHLRLSSKSKFHTRHHVHRLVIISDVNRPRPRVKTRWLLPKYHGRHRTYWPDDGDHTGYPSRTLSDIGLRRMPNLSPLVLGTTSGGPSGTTGNPTAYQP